MLSVYSTTTELKQRVGVPDRAQERQVPDRAEQQERERPPLSPRWQGSGRLGNGCPLFKVPGWRECLTQDGVDDTF